MCPKFSNTISPEPLLLLKKASYLNSGYICHIYVQDNIPFVLYISQLFNIQISGKKSAILRHLMRKKLLIFVPMTFQPSLKGFASLGCITVPLLVAMKISVDQIFEMSPWQCGFG